MKKALLVLLSVAAAAGVIAGYFGSASKPADFSYVLLAEERSIDPALCVSLQGARIVRCLFEGLTRLDVKTITPVPAVARSWEVSEDGRTYLFHLRPSLWSDSTPVTAQDFVWSWRRLLEPSSTAEYDYMLFYLKNAEKYRKGLIADFNEVGAEALDDTTLKVTLENATPFFLEITSFESLMPVNRRCVEQYGIRWTHPEHIVGNGPFLLAFHQLNYKMRLLRNPLFWDPARPRFQSVDVFVVEGINSAFNMYETGGADMMDEFPNIIAEEILKRPDNLVTPSLGTYFYRFNVKAPAFTDKRVRQAFDYAVDKEAIVRHVTKGGEVAAFSLVPPGLPGYRPPADKPRFDPDKARRLMAEAGYPGGKGFPAVELLYNTSENHKKTAEAVARMLYTELGVRITPVNVEWRVLLDKMQKIDFTFCRGSWYGDYCDPNTFLDMFVTGGGNNRTDWASPAYDSLIALAARTPGPAARMAVFSKAEALLLDETPILCLYYYVNKLMIKPGIKGVYPNIRGHFHFAEMHR